MKWQRDEVDLMELAKNRWINQMSQREIAKKMGITRGQVDWNQKKLTETTFEKKGSGKGIFELLEEDSKKPLKNMERWAKELSSIKGKFDKLDKKIKSGSFSKTDIQEYNTLIDNAQKIERITKAIEDYRGKIRTILKENYGINTQLDDSKKKAKFKEDHDKNAYNYLLTIADGSKFATGILHLGHITKDLEALSTGLKSKTKLTEVDSKSFDLAKQRNSVKNTCDDVKIPANADLVEQNE